MIDSSILDPSVLDALLASVEGDRSFLNELIDTYLSDSPALLAALRHNLEAQNVDGLRRAAHSLKSTSASLGALTLSAQAKELELMSKRGALDGAADRLAAIEQEYGRVRAAFEAYKAASGG